MQLSDRIGLLMKLHDLHLLMAVVQAGNMSKAAALLNTTQPAISRSIAELERTIGVRLLDRNSQGVLLTDLALPHVDALGGVPRQRIEVALDLLRRQCFPVGPCGTFGLARSSSMKASCGTD